MKYYYLVPSLCILVHLGCSESSPISARSDDAARRAPPVNPVPSSDPLRPILRDPIETVSSVNPLPSTDAVDPAVDSGPLVPPPPPEPTVKTHDEQIAELSLQKRQIKSQAQRVAMEAKKYTNSLEAIESSIEHLRSSLDGWRDQKEELLQHPGRFAQKEIKKLRSSISKRQAEIDEISAGLPEIPSPAQKQALESKINQINKAKRRLELDPDGEKYVAQDSVMLNMQVKSDEIKLDHAQRRIGLYKKVVKAFDDLRIISEELPRAHQSLISAKNVLETSTEDLQQKSRDLELLTERQKTINSLLSSGNVTFIEKSKLKLEQSSMPVKIFYARSVYEKANDVARKSSIAHEDESQKLAERKRSFEHMEKSLASAKAELEKADKEMQEKEQKLTAEFDELQATFESKWK